MGEKSKYTILYARLSQEDGAGDTSISIHNQRLFLEKYAQENNFENTLFLSDDGYSGTNFDRPSWKKIIDLIESNQVENLIVKDLSRLGREHIQVSYYTEMYFPSKGIRFIAVGDSVDSNVGSSLDFTPIRSWFNEQYAKETSQKVRAVKRMQAERGERTGGRTPYGYRKRGPFSKDIVPDEESAPVVQRIFRLCAEGNGPSQISKALSNDNIPPPAYSYQEGNEEISELQMDFPSAWDPGTIMNILDNIVYCGHTLSQKTTTLSYKSKKFVNVPIDEQILVKNTHEPLITEDTWNIVRDVRSHKKRPPKDLDVPHKFSGIAYCADCGSLLTVFHTKSSQQSEYHLKCITYGKHGKDACTPHLFSETDLESVVLDSLNKLITFVQTDEEQFSHYINQEERTSFDDRVNMIQKEVARLQQRISELMIIFQHLCADIALGEITDKQFQMLASAYIEECDQIENTLSARETEIEQLKESASDIGTFVKKAKNLRCLTELTPEILRSFIHRIEIGERAKKYSHCSPQEIRIFYHDIKIVDSCVFVAKYSK